MSPAKAKPAAGDGEPADESLKRLGGGRWQTRDERFTIEPQSGTWSVVDVQETDDFGLPLVRGPFKSLTEAKAAIAAARTNEAPESPLSGRVEAKAAPEPPERARSAGRDRSATRSAAPAASENDDRPAAETKPRPEPAPPRSRPKAPEAPEEPGWFRDLSPADRGRARRLIERLTAEGVPDATGIVRRDLVGDVPALAAQAIATRLAALPAHASRDDVVELLAEGRDEALGVRWRLVDGDGRPILVEAPGTRRPRGRG
jgi:hypothetical protein